MCLYCEIIPKDCLKRKKKKRKLNKEKEEKLSNEQGHC